MTNVWGESDGIKPLARMVIDRALVAHECICEGDLQRSRGWIQNARDLCDQLLKKLPDQISEEYE